MRLDDYEIEPPSPRDARPTKRLSPRAEPARYNAHEGTTKYDRDHGTTIVMERPVDIRIRNMRWLLADGFFIHHDLLGGVSVRDGFQDDTSNDASTRLMMFNYLSSEPRVVRIKEVVQFDQQRRWAVGMNSVRYPSDISLEALLSLVGEGAVAYAISREDSYIAYRVNDEKGGIAAISTWTRAWQDWWEQRT